MKLKRVYCKHFPFKGYEVLTFYPWVFIRESYRSRYTEIVDRHEQIHGVQQLETLWVLFLVLYGLEYVVKLVVTGFKHKRAYKSISFEQEAYGNECVMGYVDRRRKWGWMRYVFKLVSF